MAELPKEAIEFMTRLGGAVTSSLEDAAFEYYWATHPEMVGKFPYIRLIRELPPCDDLIVGGLAIPPWVIGVLLEEDAKKRGDLKAQELGKSVREFGEGGILYALGMLVHHTIGAATHTYASPVTIGQSPPPPSGGAPPAAIVYKL